MFLIAFLRITLSVAQSVKLSLVLSCVLKSSQDSVNLLLSTLMIFGRVQKICAEEDGFMGVFCPPEDHRYRLIEDIVAYDSSSELSFCDFSV